MIAIHSKVSLVVRDLKNPAMSFRNLPSSVSCKVQKVLTSFCWMQSARCF